MRRRRRANEGVSQSWEICCSFFLRFLTKCHDRDIFWAKMSAISISRQLIMIMKHAFILFITLILEWNNFMQKLLKMARILLLENDSIENYFEAIKKYCYQWIANISKNGAREIKTVPLSLEVISLSERQCGNGRHALCTKAITTHRDITKSKHAAAANKFYSVFSLCFALSFFRLLSLLLINSFLECLLRFCCRS